MTPGIEEYIPVSDATKGPNSIGISIEPFKLWRAADFRSYTPPDDIDILGRAILREGNLTLLLGQGGIGKSTFALALAAAQIRADPIFCGLSLSPKPRRWLFIGTENTAHRWKADIAAIDSGLKPGEQQGIDERLLVAATFCDEFPGLELPEAAGRIEATIRSAEPSVVVLDPWSELVSNEIDAATVKAAIVSLRAAVLRPARNAAILLLAHSRTGREVVAESSGQFGGPTAQRGNRALTNSARCVLMLSPRHDDGPDLVLTCTKINDGEKFAPRALSADRARLRYSIDAEFNVDDWREEVRGKTTRQKCTVQHVVAEVKNGKRTTADIVVALSALAKSRTVKDRLAAAVESGDLIMAGHGQYALGPKFNPRV